MIILPELLASIDDLPVLDVRIGVHWTAVVVERGGHSQAGLAATLEGVHEHKREPVVPFAGELTRYSSRELSGWVLESQPLRVSIGLATINACLDHYPTEWQEANAEEVIATRGVNKRVVLVGHFPFVPDLKIKVGELIVLEQNPVGDDLPASAAPQVIPQADVLAMTGMTLANRTLEELLSYRAQGAFTLLLGPSTPLHPLLFDHGIDWLSGAVVTHIDPVLRAVSQGANFHQLKQAGVRLVNMARAS
jgi:hypothetical protein